jgi:hypothetical protein
MQDWEISQNTPAKFPANYLYCKKNKCYLQRTRVQRLPSNPRPRDAIDLIPHQRMSQMRQVQPNLVRSARFREASHERDAAEAVAEL